MIFTRPKFYGLLVLALVSAFPAMAQSGLNYTTRSKVDTQNQGEHLRSYSYVRPEAKPSPDPEKNTETPTPAEDGSASDKAWQRYKDLAAGKYKEESKATPKEEAGKEPPAPAKPTGFAALLQQYQQNRAARSEMRTISVTKPKPETTEEKAEEPKQKEDEKDKD